MAGGEGETDALEFTCGSEDLRARCDIALARAKHWGWVVAWEWDVGGRECRCLHPRQLGSKLRWLINRVDDSLVHYSESDDPNTVALAPEVLEQRRASGPFGRQTGASAFWRARTELFLQEEAAAREDLAAQAQGGGAGVSVGQVSQ
mmetsp:Transcript_39840/g.97915  ORF Transcript_39840/g.97915 Transcript_39840/m.97915 type:complete len:147 (-) Transcript_39840:614-1054(-)|eukprot:CAMPEP_0206237708 /NCGR_PEP_ID=MMETSP0047_2-20121206/14411_1 /ASSEMBLY_ACC=CAM_ASM_000192 /TAXON_ID=195065 /ORGANISM="Chroomonas mesostigmatica_cf, Strain CCMP1168" /LENGTH=146 /DNA_ID=CAMNT_0053662165 /DNA_START=365 /DNA_END=805 /DNA_ORIENTATION=-